MSTLYYKAKGECDETKSQPSRPSSPQLDRFAIRKNGSIAPHAQKPLLKESLK